MNNSTLEVSNYYYIPNYVWMIGCLKLALKKACDLLLRIVYENACIGFRFANWIQYTPV